MLKKFISLASVLTIVTTILPFNVAFAEIDENLIGGIVTQQNFNPSAGETLNINVQYNAEASDALSLGDVRIFKGNEEQEVLVSWGSLDGFDAPLSEIQWNGMCGAELCENGNDYSVRVYIKLQNGKSDEDFSGNFSITNQAINITNPTVNPASFNPSTNQSTTVAYSLSAAGAVTVDVLDSNNEVVKNLLPATAQGAGANSVVWNGRNNSNQLVANGVYKFRIEARANAADANPIDTEMVNVTVSGQQANTQVTAFTATASNGGNFDPAADASDETLLLHYELTQQVGSVIIQIKNADDDQLKQFSSTNRIDNFTWDGTFNNKLVVPGTYTAVLTAANANQTPVTSTTTFVVEYPSANKANLSGFTVSPSSFDPDSEDTVISFRNSARADITVEIQNLDGTVIRTFNQFDEDDTAADTNNTLTWNGQNNNGDNLGTGNYKVVITTRNTFGVVVESQNVSITDTGQALLKSNSHIDGISCRPSGTFEPAEDEFLKCEADTKLDGLEVHVFAVRGSDEIELFDDTNLDKGNNTIEFEWDGTDDDDEYVDPGTWRIEFRSRKDNVGLTAGITKTIEYATPKIDEFIINKKEIDNDLDEVAYALFRLDDDANVSLYYLQDGDRDDDIVEDMEVEKDLWYAVEIDGSGYDYGDDIDIELVAANIANTDVDTTRRASFNIKEDDVSSSKSNVTRDFIAPVVTSCDEDIEIGYDIEDDADVYVSIHRGKTNSGSKVIDLVAQKDQDSGEHTLTWNCRDSNGRKLSDGFYTYEIESKLSSTDTEYGIFIVDQKIGDVDGGSGGSSSGSSNGNINPNVVIDGQGGNNNGGSDIPNQSGKCAGFSDVSAADFSCDAVTWAKDAGVFRGYADGTFGFYKQINRAELLKVITEATALAIGGTPTDNQGFDDVEVGAWYMRYIKAAKDVGIFNGDAGKRTARPGDNVNKAEALKLAFEAVRVDSGYQATLCTDNFNDVNQGDWYFKYACESQRYLLFDDELTGNNFFGAKKVSRGEIVEMLYRMHLYGLL